MCIAYVFWEKHLKYKLTEWLAADSIFNLLKPASIFDFDPIIILSATIICIEQLEGMNVIYYYLWAKWVISHYDTVMSCKKWIFLCCSFILCFYSTFNHKPQLRESEGLNFCTKLKKIAHCGGGMKLNIQGNWLRLASTWIWSIRFFFIYFLIIWLAS